MYSYYNMVATGLNTVIHTATNVVYVEVHWSICVHAEGNIEINVLVLLA